MPFHNKMFIIVLKQLDGLSNSLAITPTIQIYCERIVGKHTFSEQCSSGI